MEVLSGILTAFFALFLLSMAVAALVNRPFAERFLRLFASTRRAHFIEQFLRLAVGLALINFSPRMSLSLVFCIFGWVIAVTAIALMLTPWRLHHWFAGLVIPKVIDHLRLFGFGAFLMGVFVFYGLSRVVMN